MDNVCHICVSSDTERWVRCGEFGGKMKMTESVKAGAGMGGKGGFPGHRLCKLTLGFFQV